MYGVRRSTNTLLTDTMGSTADSSSSSRATALSPAADHHEDVDTMDCATAGNSGAPSPAASQGDAGAASGASCDGVTFTLTEGNEVVASGGARAVQREREHPRRHLRQAVPQRGRADVQQGDAEEAMIFLVIVQEDQRRIVSAILARLPIRVSCN
ncbi:hypothetical protein HU200_062004 [Digitaria exilis]|uniref:Uncharacterized protein n=1 Tax=Digitaria exilis TaxID=1010633 RepID=A0A835A6Z7_9POAL|nr:hypothetical protein HU200_062004 [Digitaria exilis]